MSHKDFSVPTLGLLSAVLLGFVVLAGCGGGSSGSTTTTPTGTPAVGLSASTLTFSSGVGVASASQSVTVTNSGTATLTFSGFQSSNTVFALTPANTCGTSLAAGGTCSVYVTFTPTAAGAASANLTITDNASPTTQTVKLNGTGSSASVSPISLTFSGITVGTISPAQNVTLTNASSTALTISSISITAGEPFAISSNTCGTSVAASGNCTIGVTFSPTVAGTFNATLTITDSASSSPQTVSLTGSNTFANQTQVTVGFGINGNTNNQNTNYYNGIFTTVTVCTPGTTTCVQVPNVLVDTGSVGLRVLSTAITGVTLPQINDPASGYPLYECVQFGDLSYTWGPMQSATVQVGGETASGVPAASGGSANTGIPIQVIAAGQTPPSTVGPTSASAPNGYVNSCLYYSGSTVATDGSNDDTITTLGANGILGVGNFPQDCSFGGVNYCNTTVVNGQYLICQTVGSSTCNYQSASIADQAWNPVAAFPVDNNGVNITLPVISSNGTTTVNGTLTFGIGTESNNGLSGATIYGLDAGGNFASATYNNVTFCTSGVSTCPTNEGSGGTFIDSGSNAFFVSDGVSLNNTPDCIVSTIDIGYYCPSSNLNLSLGLAGSNGNTTTVSLPIESATTLFSNTSFAAFNDLGGPSCTPDAAASITCSTSTDYFDLGLPFFFGQPHGVFVGISGTSLGSTTYTNGYWAF